MDFYYAGRSAQFVRIAVRNGRQLRLRDRANHQEKIRQNRENRKPFVFNVNQGKESRLMRL